MKPFYITLISLGILFQLPILTKAQVRLPRFFSSNMVLQQNADVAIWGWSSPAEKISITTSWNAKTDSTVASRDAKWSMVVHTPPAGGPFTITLQASNTIILENVLIGEVWVLSGQSNMEWSALNNNKQAQEEAPNALNPNLRLFQVPKTTAAHPQDDCPGEWKVCNPDDMRRFSTIGYFFGKRLQEELKVPIGLINASWGGTPAEVWTPREIIENDVQLREAAEQISPTPWWPSDPAYAFNAMIAPLTAYKISGALWYQGESNTGRPNLYPRLFTNMIQSWRKAWKDDFPFYYVQIAPFNYDRPLIGALLREAQTQSSYLP
ncbi:MAG: sialate O-acetylesterase, partial [Chitinophagaceae bacterium]